MIPRWLRRTGLALFAVPFVGVGLWLARVRLDEHREISSSLGARDLPSLVGASGPVRLSGTLQVVRPARASDGAEVALSLTAARRLERGGGARVCLARGGGPALRLDSGEQVSLSALWDAQLDVGGWRRAVDADLAVVRVLAPDDTERAVDDADACPAPPVLGGRLSAVEHVVPVGARVTVVACARDGTLEPCGADATAIVVGSSLAPLVRAREWGGERAAFLAFAHLVLGTVLGLLSFRLLRPPPPRRGRVEVVSP